MTRTSFGDQLQQMWQTRPARLPRHGPVAGVAAGVGHRYGVDPVLVRVAFVVSTIFGGAGIVLYLLGWLLFPEPGEGTSMAESLGRKRPDSHNQTKTIVLIVALAIAVSTMGPVGVGLGGSGVIALALMLAGWWMLYLRSPQPPPLPAGGTEAPVAPGTTGYPGTAFPQAGVDPYTSHITGIYTPYTKLPDRYVPDAPAPTGENPPVAAAPQGPAVSAAGPDGAGGTATERPAGHDADTPPTGQHGDPVQGATGSASTPDATTPDSGPRLSVAPADPGPRTAGPARSADRTASTDGTAATGPVTSPGPFTSPSPLSSADPATPTDPATSADPAADGPAPHADAQSSGGKTFPAPGGNRPGSPGPTVGLSKSAGLTDRTPPAWDPLGVAPLAWDLPEPTPAHPVATVTEKRPRSRFTLVVLGLAILAAAGAGAVAAAGADWMTPGRIAAVALAVIGLGLMLGAFRRRGHGLLLVTAPLAAFVILAAAVGPVDFQDSTVGDRTWAPAAAGEVRPEYAVTMGSGTLDLRGIELTENKTVDVSVQMGEAVVLVPENMNVRTDCTVRMGEANCPDGLTGPGGDAPVLNLNVEVRMGEAEVRRG
ncbi:PspC domain-containing protein [Nocardia sp. CA-290969]|uniref:PspC domain-containing protein n=1 Tax=Nocardia sp. CA-290969 TaxID=3239986 RepID=UPI003D8C8C8E